MPGVFRSFAVLVKMAKVPKWTNTADPNAYVNHFCHKVVINRNQKTSKILPKTRESLLITGVLAVENSVGTVDNSLQCYYSSRLCHSAELQLFQFGVKLDRKKSAHFSQIQFG